MHLVMAVFTEHIILFEFYYHTLTLQPQQFIDVIKSAVLAGSMKLQLFGVFMIATILAAVREFIVLDKLQVVPLAFCLCPFGSCVCRILAYAGKDVFVAPNIDFDRPALRACGSSICIIHVSEHMPGRLELLRTRNTRVRQPIRS